MSELMGDQRTRLETARESTGEEGFLLVAVIVMVFLVLLALSIAAPRIAMQIKRDREQETKERAEQYDRAIQLYYRKFKHYPNSIEELKKSNNQRFLRQEYVDPLTGQKDWRLIHVGENKTQVKGFFGEDLPGIGGASGLTGIGNSSGSGTSSGGSAFNNGSSGSTFGSGSSGSGFGSGSGGFSTGSSFGAGTGAGGSSTGSSSGTTGNGSGVASQDATTFGGSGGGPIMGVGVPKQGEALMTVNEQTNYQDWEFLYDPRIEQLRARASLMGGINSGSGTSPSGSTPIGASGAFNNGGNNGFGSGSLNNNGTGSSNGTTMTPSSPQ